jgi:hypothetical protein
MTSSLEKVIPVAGLVDPPSGYQEDQSSNGTPTKENEKSKGNPTGSGLNLRVFTPHARVYFDTGVDERQAGEVDIFKDGSIAPTINLLELYYAIGNPRWLALSTDQDWYFGPAVGFGLGPAPGGNEPGSGAAILLLTGGLLLDFPLISDNSRIGIEAGYAQGYSASESATDDDDGATYVGMTFTLAWGSSSQGKSQ